MQELLKRKFGFQRIDQNVYFKMMKPKTESRFEMSTAALDTVELGKLPKQP
jgi:hypothetical protein